MVGVDDAGARWAAGGLAELTGDPDGPPDFSRAAVLATASRQHPAAATLLAGRAGLLGLRRRGRISPGGGTRLLGTVDGWIALTLSRDDDIAVVPALLCSDTVDADPWPQLSAWSAARPAAEAVERAVLLDLPVAALGETEPAAPVIRPAGERSAPRPIDGLLVADLTSMWAGPLCAKLLGEAGAVVVKVESPRRPDGTRAGDPRFFDWMNAGKLSAAIDFDTQTELLRRLIGAADVVLEGSRPAALERRHLGPADITGLPGRVWLRITGHGAASTRVAFGDDAAVAGGLVGRGRDGPVFCGDAIADPLTGIAAAAAVTESLGRGGGELIELSMAAVAANYAALPSISPTVTPGCAPPPVPVIAGRASELGADNAALTRLLDARGIRC